MCRRDGEGKQKEESQDWNFSLVVVLSLLVVVVANYVTLGGNEWWWQKEELIKTIRIVQSQSHSVQMEKVGDDEKRFQKCDKN